MAARQILWQYTGLENWLQTLREFYNETAPKAKFWITEMALPKEDEEATLSMMNESLRKLDSLDYVQAYAWFGAFRSDEANEWTGDSVSLFDDDGGLTKLGVEYLGGKSKGFEEGMSGGLRQAPTSSLVLVGLMIAAFLTW
ncbi:hypothetical protein NW754_008726 [Fusarium falciforme]|nr:hypothetical protein NW754_008726 [Fusarium falciforme]